MDVNEIRTKLVQDYRRIWINKHRYELNDDEVDVEDCNSKLGYIVDMLMFITGWSREAVGESLASHLNYQIKFDPQMEPEKWDLNKFDFVETVDDIYYNDLATILEDWETTEDQLKRDGFKIEDNGKGYWVLIPAGTIMRFDGPDCNCWPTFTLRMRTQDYELDFAGDPFKVKLL